MLSICVEGCKGRSSEGLTGLGDGDVTLDCLHRWAQRNLPVPREDIYFTHNGKRLLDNTPISDGVIRVVPRLLGGKGGFGSMLRAIGAQIEKTTNREACRDLSGRRLRDINEEKRLKNWISKKADRERETAERKQKKLEKLRSEPKIEFSDKKYEEERTKLTEVVHDAVEKGFQAATSNPSSSGVTNKSMTKKKGFMLEEEEFSDDSSEDSSDEQSEHHESLRREAESDSDNESPAKKHPDEQLECDVSLKRKAASDSDESCPAKRPHAKEFSSDSSDESSSKPCDKQ